ncbi:RNA/RNP complex-1-interacting phosphatase isoform X1 [Coregonus clupeaformis]|uniref:RNA/RNP complex-1-interacting phosphatase isoform X1 n=2 Tax=Coregonus clupeaformis TaxID=59861 RepID=UPI001BDFD88E|nr:RNA/RNP complex-1-interacting phosphatase isoform X1 [Coregonus clupeaformis]
MRFMLNCFRLNTLTSVFRSNETRFMLTVEKSSYFTGEPKKKMPPHKKNGIPDRWEDYQAVGKIISGTRFIAFKVPLKPSLCRHVERSEAFGPWELMQTMEKDGQELGLIIDLTFTTRYYKPEDLPDSVLYLKIFTAGHEVPSDPTILSFKRAVRRFLRDNTHNDKLIGVHCTHGLNRTGYLVCRYLIDVDGMDPKEAVELFNSSRGHSIERGNYLKDLQTGPKRSNDGMEESEQEPIRGSSGSQHNILDYPAHRDRHYDRHYDHNQSQSVPLHQKGMNHQTHGLPPPLPPYGMWPPHPSLLPRPPYFNNYQWRPPQPQNNWRRPYPPEEDRRRGEDWRSSHYHERTRIRYPPGPSPCPVLPRYSPKGWTNEPEGSASSLPSEEISGPQRKVRPRHKHTRSKDRTK